MGETSKKAIKTIPLDVVDQVSDYFPILNGKSLKAVQEVHKGSAGNQLVVAMTLLDICMKASVLPQHVRNLVAGLNHYVESELHISEQLIACDRNEINKGDFKSLVATDMFLLYYKSQQDDRDEGLQMDLSQPIDITFKNPLERWKTNGFKLRL